MQKTANGKRLPFLSRQKLLAMKLLMILTVTACFHVQARVTAQTITLKTSNATLEKVLREVKKQTGYDYFLNAKLVRFTKPITMDADHLPLEQFLKACFKDQPITYEVVDKTIIIKEKQEKPAEGTSSTDNPVPPPVVRGRITNENGEPIPGVSISIKGGKVIGVTGDDGSFVLNNVPDDAVLVFSAVTIETFETKLNGRAELRLSAATKVSRLEDVEITANTGYQQMKPNEGAGSVVVIDNKRLNQQTGTSILQRLDGVTSGLAFNIGKSSNQQNNTNISIRGMISINGPLDPLIVLDNFIYEGDINNINPNDVENVTILKDAVATSIYGPRGGNGVIVITTKKGRFNQKTKVSFSSNLIYSPKPDLDYLPQMSSSDYINVEQFLFNRGYFNATINNTTTRPSLTPAVEIFLRRRNNAISAGDSASQIDGLKAIDSRNGYDRYFYQPAVIQQYSLMVRGGTQQLAWLVAGALDKSKHMLQDTKDKANFRFENTFRPIQALNINLGVYYTNASGITSMAPAFNSIAVGSRLNVPYLSFADANGNAVAVDRDYRGIYTDTAGAGRLLDWKYYPLNDFQYDRTRSKLEDMVVNASVDYRFFKGLSATLAYQYQQQRYTTERISQIESYEARNTINRFSQLNRSTGIVTYIVPRGGIYSISNAITRSQNLRGQFNYAASWKDHAVSAIAGAEIREAVGSGSYTRMYGYTADPLTYAAVDYRNVYPVFNTGSSVIPGAPYPSPVTTYRFADVYANASYLYKGRYQVNLSARKDGSNVYGVNTNDRWNPFWSVGAGWEISKERFYQVNWLTYLKLRVSYGYNGNVDMNRTAAPVIRYGTQSISNLPMARVTTLNNPELQWEKVGQFNAGLDFQALKGVITGTIEYYKKKGSNLYGPTPLDYTTWGASNTITRNVANMEGEGVDISLNAKIINRAIRWSAGLLYNYNHNRTTEYFGPNTGLLSPTGIGNTITPVIGKPLYAISAYRWAGLDAAGNPQGLLDGQPSINYAAITNAITAKGEESGSMYYVGPTVPTSFGAIFHELQYKQFSLSVNISYKFGYYFRKPVLQYAALVNNGAGHPEYAQRWQKPGDELVTNVPSFVYPLVSRRDDFYTFSDINVLKGDHIRLQFVNLSYRLTGNKIKYFEQLELYVNAANLGILWRANKYGLDPDYPSVLPAAKSFTIGIRATF